MLTEESEQAKKEQKQNNKKTNKNKICTRNVKRNTTQRNTTITVQQSARQKHTHTLLYIYQYDIVRTAYTNTHVQPESERAQRSALSQPLSLSRPPKLSHFARCWRPHTHTHNHTHRSSSSRSSGDGAVRWRKLASTPALSPCWPAVTSQDAAPQRGSKNKVFQIDNKSAKFDFLPMLVTKAICSAFFRYFEYLFSACR